MDEALGWRGSRSSTLLRKLSIRSIEAGMDTLVLGNYVIEKSALQQNT